MDLKEHAQKLMKLAESIEKEAYDNTFFICSHCNHTASLAEINDRRVKFAAQEDPEITVKPVSINDTVVCPVPGCEGKMAYIATDASEKYYTEEKDSAEKSDPAEEPMTEDTVKEEKPDKDTAKEELSSGKKDDKLDAEIDKLFEDVETQNENRKEENKDKTDTIQKARKEKKEKEEQTDLLGDPNSEKSELPKDEDPLAEPEKKTEPDPSAVKEDKIEPEPKKEEKPKKKKEPIDLEKKDVPKFKSKEAAERYEQSCSRYSV